MKFIRREVTPLTEEELIMENKDQALSILKKRGLTEENVDYLQIKDSVDKVFKNNLNYLGLMVKYHFEQEVSVQELKDLLPWLKDNGNRLKGNPLTYKKFEDIKDEIIKIDNDQRVKTIYNLLPKRQKDMVNGDIEFYEKSLAIHKSGFIKEFGRKLSAKKTKEDILKYMSDFINKNSESINYDKVITSLRVLNSKIIYEDPDEGMIMAEILDFETSQEVGSPDWCIVTSRTNWDYYTKGTNVQFFVWDFSLERTAAQFMIGFTTNGKGQITDIHDKYDVSLTGDIPEKISDLLVKRDFSVDPFKYKVEILKFIEDDDDFPGIQGTGGEKLLRMDDKSKTNLIVVRVRDSWGYNRMKGDRHPTLYFNDIMKYNVYVVFNFDHELTSKDFSYVILSSKTKDTLLEVHDNSTGVGKISIEENGDYIVLEKDEDKGMFRDEGIEEPIIDWYKSGYIDPMDIEEVSREEKKVYLNKIELYVKGSVEISAPYKTAKRSKYINTSDDPGSTGRYWLFKMEHDEFNLFKTPEMGSYGRFGNYDNIHSHNYYVLIDIDADYYSEDFVRFIKISDQEGLDKMQLNNSKEIIDVVKFSDDIEKLIDDGFIVRKLRSEYNREISDARREIFNNARSEYGDTDTKIYGRALFEYLCDEDEIDKDDYMEYDDDDNEIGVPDDAFESVLIPAGDHYNLKSFSIYNNQMLSKGMGYGSSEWAIGSDDESDSSLKEYVQGMIDDMGPTGFSEWVWKNNLDTDRLVDYFLEGEDDYYRTEITDNPEYYNIEKSMKSGVDDKIEESNEAVEALDERIEKYSDRLEKVQYKLQEFRNYVTTLEETTDEHEEQDDSYETLITEYEDEITEMGSKKDDLEELVTEMEDEDNEDYWEIPENEIDDEVESQMDNKRREITDDPAGYASGMGFEDEFLSDFIDLDAMLEDILADEERGTISGYDGQERETNYEDVYYYIYRIN